MVILMNYASLPEYSVAIPKPACSTHIYTRAHIYTHMYATYVAHIYTHTSYSCLLALPIARSPCACGFDFIELYVSCNLFLS